MHVAAHDDGAGALVDDDAGGAVGVDRDFFQFGEELDGAGGIVGRNSDADERGIFGVSDGRSVGGKLAVHGLGDAGRGGEIGIVELEAHAAGGIDGGCGALDDGAGGHTADGWVVDGLIVAAVTGDESAGDYGALGDGVDVTVGAAQASQQQHAALKVLGVADGGGGGVDVRAGLCERRQGGGDHDGRGVFDGDD